MNRLLFILVAASAIAAAHPGNGIVRDSRGNIYYTDLSRVWKISPDGKKTVAVPDVHTHELSIDRHDRLFGEHLWYNGEQANTWGHFVWRYSADGSFEKVIPHTAGFLREYAFVRDTNGTMFWIDDRRIYQKSITGAVSLLSPHILKRAVRLAVSPSGEIYFPENGKLQYVGRDGAVRTAAVVERPGRPFDVYGIWFGPQREVYAAVWNTKQVKKVTQTGEVSIVHVSEEGWSPTGGLIDDRGDLWVMEYSPQNTVRVLHKKKNSPAKVF